MDLRRELDAPAPKETRDRRTERRVSAAARPDQARILNLTTQRDRRGLFCDW